MEGRRLTPKDVGSLVIRCKGVRLHTGFMDVSFTGEPYRLLSLQESPLEYRICYTFTSSITGEFKDSSITQTLDGAFLDDWVNVTEYEQQYGKMALDELIEKIMEHRVEMQEHNAGIKGMRS